MRPFSSRRRERPSTRARFEVSEGLERRGHHMKYWPVLVTEDLLRHFERAYSAYADEVEHLGFAIAMMLDQLVGAMAMVLIDGAMRGQHYLDVEVLHLSAASR